jgi:hypothetical protein
VAFGISRYSLIMNWCKISHQNWRGSNDRNAGKPGGSTLQQLQKKLKEKIIGVLTENAAIWTNT